MNKNNRLRLIQIVFLVLFWLITFIAFVKADLTITTLSTFGFCLNLLIIAFHHRIFKQ